MSRLLTVLLCCLALAACSNQTSRRADTYERIGQELVGAASEKQTRDAVDRAMLPPLPVEAPSLPKSEPRFNLAVNNASVTQVLTAIVSGTPYSMLFAPEVAGNVSLNLKNITVREALDTLRDIFGYDYKMIGNRIHVYPNTIQARIFKINYLSSRRHGTSDTRITGSSPSTSSSGGSGSSSSQPTATGAAPSSGGQTTTRAPDSARVQTTSDNDFWGDIKLALETIVGTKEGNNVVTNPASGVVLVRALPTQLREVEDYLKATQLVVERQVMLEAKIVEVELNDSFQTGINWAKLGGVTNKFALGVLAPNASIGASGAIFGNAAGLAGGSTAVGIVPGLGGAAETGTAGRGLFGMAYQSHKFAALLSFLEEQGDVQVLSSPRIATTNNQKAVLKVGTDDYYVTNVSTTVTSTTTGNVVTPNITLLPFFSGISLDVTPQIDEDGNIVLHIHPSVSEVTEKTKDLTIGNSSYSLPLASSTINESDTVVRVADGSIVAIGGLMRQKQDNSRAGLPGASGVPGLGLLFGQKSASNSKRELVILLRSTVIKDEKNWRDLAAEAQERVQAYDPRQTRTIEVQ